MLKKKNEDEKKPVTKIIVISICLKLGMAGKINKTSAYLIQKLAFSNHLGLVLCRILICDILP